MGCVARIAVQLEPAVDSAGCGDGKEAGGRDGGAMQAGELGLYLLETQAKRGPAGGIEAVEFAGFGVIDDGEEIASRAATHWLHEAEGGIGRDGGIDGGAAGFQNIDADLRGQRLARADHAVLREHFGARGEAATPVTVLIHLRGQAGVA